MIEITMDGPGKNALGTAMMTFLVERLREADGQPVLLTGAGDAFSAGLNLKELASLDGPGTERFLRLLEECVSALYLHRGPTVALVNGHAIAGGCVLTLCCDHRIAARSPKTRIGLNEVAIGIRFPPRTLRMARDRVPPRSSSEVLLGAALHDVDNALRLGLIDEIADDAPTVARERLAALARHPPEAYAATKADLRGRSPSDLASDSALDRWLAESIPLWTSPTVRQTLLRLLGTGSR